MQSDGRKHSLLFHSHANDSDTAARLDYLSEKIDMLQQLIMADRVKSRSALKRMGSRKDVMRRTSSSSASTEHHATGDSTHSHNRSSSFAGSSDGESLLGLGVS